MPAPPTPLHCGTALSSRCGGWGGGARPDLRTGDLRRRPGPGVRMERGDELAERQVVVTEQAPAEQGQCVPAPDQAHPDRYHARPLNAGAVPPPPVVSVGVPPFSIPDLRACRNRPSINTI